jgi:hypothetical protein
MVCFSNLSHFSVSSDTFGRIFELSLVATHSAISGNCLAVKTGSGAQELEPVSVSGLAEFELFPVAAEIFRDTLETAPLLTEADVKLVGSSDEVLRISALYL